MRFCHDIILTVLRCFCRAVFYFVETWNFLNKITLLHLPFAFLVGGISPDKCNNSSAAARVCGRAAAACLGCAKPVFARQIIAADNIPNLGFYG